MNILHSFYCWGWMFIVILSTIYFKIFGIENWRYLSIFWAIFPIICSILFLKVPINTLKSEGNENNSISIRKLLSVRIVLAFVLLMICSGASEHAVAQWVSFFAEVGLNVNKTVGDLFGACMFAFCMGIVRLIYGMKSENIDINKALTVSSIFCMFGYLIIAFSPIAFLSLIGCTIVGLSVGIMWPSVFSLASKTYPKGGTAMFAVLALAGDVGCSIGPGIVGIISNNKTIINTGSVGNSFDAIRNKNKDSNALETTKSNYLIIEGEYESKNYSSDISFQFIKVPYDIDKELEEENYQGNAVVNYTEYEIPYTRIIEHKHFEYGPSLGKIAEGETARKTIITREYPDKWVQGKEPYYTMNDEKNTKLYEKYKELADKDKKVIFGGRLGQYKYFDMDKVIAEALKISNEGEDIILELSSFQLETIENFHPHISAILNIAEDHLDRYKDIEDYFNAKKNIYKNQNSKDFLILNHDNIFTNRLFNELKKNKEEKFNILTFSTKNKNATIYYNNEEIFYKNKKLFSIKKRKLFGMHNVENILASILICLKNNIPIEYIENAINNFNGIEHRLELVDNINNVMYINDSKATSMNSVMSALKSFDKNIILIMGGRNKNIDFSPLNDIIKERVKKLILIGEASKILNDMINFENKIISDKYFASAPTCTFI
mgnify:CR=1 FL=1